MDTRRGGVRLMSEKEPRPILYLLRLWQTKSGGDLVWRASLQIPRVGERTRFTSLEALFAFLQQLTGVVADSDGEKR